MKTFFRVLISSFILSILFTLIPFQNSCAELNNDVFRLHILANSDSAADQSLKLAVRDRILEEMSQLYVDAATKEDAERITAQNLTRIRTVAQQTLRDNGCGDAVTVEMKNMYFNTRYYDDFTMPAGYYDALRVRIGSAEGQNWWCVMYPSLCVGTASRHSAKESLSEGEYQVISSDEPEFRFKLVEYYERLRSFFR